MEPRNGEDESECKHTDWHQLCVGAIKLGEHGQSCARFCLLVSLFPNVERTQVAQLAAFLIDIKISLICFFIQFPIATVVVVLIYNRKKTSIVLLMPITGWPLTFFVQPHSSSCVCSRNQARGLLLALVWWSLICLGSGLSRVAVIRIVVGQGCTLMVVCLCKPPCLLSVVFFEVCTCLFIKRTAKTNRRSWWWWWCCWWRERGRKRAKRQAETLNQEE